MTEVYRIDYIGLITMTVLDCTGWTVLTGVLKDKFQLSLSLSLSLSLRDKINIRGNWQFAGRQ